MEASLEELLSLLIAAVVSALATWLRGYLHADPVVTPPPDEPTGE